MGRRNGTSASKEYVAKVFVRLHKEHISPAVIADATGYSPGYVRQILDERGHKERWNDSGDVLLSIDADLAADCMNLRDKGKGVPH